jgi:hypothetical protein
MGDSDQYISTEYIEKDPTKIPGGKAGGAAFARKPSPDRRESSRKAHETQAKNMRGEDDHTMEDRGSSWQIEKDLNVSKEALEEQYRAGEEEGAAVQARVEKEDKDYDPNNPDDEGPEDQVV